jgi:hypothetical protein
MGGRWPTSCSNWGSTWSRKCRPGSSWPIWARTTWAPFGSPAARRSASNCSSTEPPATTAKSRSCAAMAASASPRLNVPVAVNPADRSTSRASRIFSGARPTTMTWPRPWFKVRAGCLGHRSSDHPRRLGRSAAPPVWRARPHARIVLGRSVGERGQAKTGGRALRRRWRHRGDSGVTSKYDLTKRPAGLIAR